MVDPVPFAPDEDWHAKLKFVVDMMRELSLQSDPQEMVRSYGEKVRTLLPSDRRISLSVEACRLPTAALLAAPLGTMSSIPGRNPKSYLYSKAESCRN